MRRPEGWFLVGLAAVVVAAVTGGVLATAGTGEAGLGAGLRATARLSLLLFLPTFTASALTSLTRTGWAKWLLRNRRYLGLSFAVSHFTHLGLIAALASARGQAFPTPAAIVAPGGLAYLLLAAMVLTSTDRSARWLGRRAWRVLHLTGMYALFLVFAVTYGKRVTSSPGAAVAFLALAAALGLRGAAWLRRRRR